MTKIELSNWPARIHLSINVAGETFFARITYESVDSWDKVWSAASCADPSTILGTIVAWEAMRFMSLGGRTLRLCKGLSVNKTIANLWRECFLRQYGEWRYRNNIQYLTGEPNIEPTTQLSLQSANRASHFEEEMRNRVLLANGGGKDSLVGMLIMSSAGIDFDVFEGTTPIGGTPGLQRQLLNSLRREVVPNAATIRLLIEDDFYDSHDRRFEQMGVEAKYFRSDFAVGATANYVGLFPLLLAHDYSCVYFNIEGSADTPNLDWNGEWISHQWCKSTEYRHLMSQLFRELTGRQKFLGFPSTLSGLTDTVIYDIACSEPHKLMASHSCNVGKPWCGQCPKCCFAYLMMSVRLGEAYARETMGIQGSLFCSPVAESAWRDLLEPSRIAWECVPSHGECLSALSKLPEICILPPWMHKIRVNALDRSRKSFKIIDWNRVSVGLRHATMKRLGSSKVESVTNVVVVGGGQSGLAISRILQRDGIPHVVIEARDVGSSWQSRWDSFRLNTPNRTLQLPDFHYEGRDPNGFSSKTDVIQFLQRYAEKFDLPVITNCPVTRVSERQDGFLVETKNGSIQADAVVVATGEYVVAKLPSALQHVPSDLTVVHSSNYRNADQFPPGAVLVVGGGQSGAQIVEDLLDSRRRVFWSISGRPSNTRRLYNRDFMEWWEIGGILHRHVNDIPEVKLGIPGALRRARSTEFPLVSGVGSGGLGRSISLIEIKRRGVMLLGKLERIVNEVAFFSNDLQSQISRAVSGTRTEFEMLNSFADKYFGASTKPTLETGYVPAEVWDDIEIAAVVNQLDLKLEGINTVVAATGYRSAWPWLDIQSVLDTDGYPLGENGISPISGLFFVGLFNLQRLSSTCLCNGGRDAELLLPAIKKRLSDRFLRTESSAGRPENA